MTRGCPQGYAEKVSLICQGEEEMSPGGLTFLLLNALKTSEGVNWWYFWMNPVCICFCLLQWQNSIQRNKERFWQLKQTAKPKKANISSWYKSSSKGITVRMNWHLRCPNMWSPALGRGLESSTGRVHAVSSNLPVHSLQADRKKTEQKANKEKVLRLQRSHIHYLGQSTQLAAAYVSLSSAQAGFWILYTANGCVSLLPQPDFLLCIHSYCGVYICQFTLDVCIHVGVCHREAC